MRYINCCVYTVCLLIFDFGREQISMNFVGFLIRFYEVLLNGVKDIIFAGPAF